MASWGETLARLVDARIARPQTNSAAITALKAKDRRDGMLVLDKATRRLWTFDLGSSATATADVLAPDAGSGRWHSADASSGSGGAHWINARGRSSGALAAYTRTANVILADAVGALGAQDGVTYLAGQIFFLHPDDAAAGADAGPYVVDDPGGVAAKYQFTRATGADTDAELPGLLIETEEGTLYEDKLYQITNNSVTLNTTAITAELVPSTTQLAATTTGLGADLLGVHDNDAVITATTGGTALVELAKRQLAAVADDAALVAITAAQRVDGALCIKLDDQTLWNFDSGSSAGASDWVQVPAAGTGRWLRKDALAGLLLPPVADNAALLALAAIDRVDGSLLVQLDTMQVWKYDLGSVAGASDWVVIPTDGTGRWHDVGYPNGGLVLPPVADNAALIALTAVDRQDGSIVVQLDTMYAWRYDLGSVAGADAWTVVPTDGVGRWVRTDIAVADAAGVTAITGGELIGQYDPNNVITAVTMGAAAREIATDLNTHRPGSPMFSRLIMLGAPGAIVGGDTVVIGGDTYEFNTNSPPDAGGGGTPGFIWVYQGASSAVSRANFINAVNAVVDALNITYDAAVTEDMLAAAGTTLGTVDVSSADVAGGTEAASDVATATTETLTTATDIWDDTTMYGGKAQAHTQLSTVSITLTAAMITAGFLEWDLMFVPLDAIILNRTRPVQQEAWTITGDRIVLTLAGGGAPNNQAGDVLHLLAMG